MILDRISLLQAEIRRGETTPELTKELSQKEEELQELHLDLRTEHPAFHAFRYPEPANILSVQERLGDSELLAQYFLGEEQSRSDASPHHGSWRWGMPTTPGTRKWSDPLP